MIDRETEARARFSCTDRDRALFEAGIKMGTIYHQFVGTPFNADTVDSLEEGIARAISVQPYVTAVQVSIDRSGLDSGGDRYSYRSLTGDMIDAIVTVCVGESRVTAEMRYDNDLHYPLMYVSDVC